MVVPLDVTGRLALAPVVAAARSDGAPVVALESTLISHGLPYPLNLEVALDSEAAVRAAGAVPATVAIWDGRILVGLDRAQLEALATAPAGSVRKAARPSLAIALVSGGWAATTVSATMIAAHAAGIRVFATGGIGGVHRGALGGSFTAGSGLDAAAPTFDISSDLDELARTPMAIVCAGPKAILDVPATIEYLETRGVPVVAIGQPDIPDSLPARRGSRRRPVLRISRLLRTWCEPISDSGSAPACWCACLCLAPRPCPRRWPARRCRVLSARPMPRRFTDRNSPRGSLPGSPP